MIKQAHLCFADVSSGEIHEDIWSVLKEGYWKEAVPINHESNVILGPLNRSAWLPVFPNYLPIEPGQKWNPQSRSVAECNVNARKEEKHLSDFLDITETFFKRFEGKHIGVQLSGGMDSSLIIGLLKHFGIPYSLVGMSSERYEFRTEKWIQQKLSTDAKGSILLSFEDHLPITSLSDVPAHQYPDLSSCSFSSNNAMATCCMELGINVLFSGTGGDLLFGSKVLNNSCAWQPAVFNDSWLQDIVFGVHEIELISFFSDPDICACIWNMRRGHDTDPQKIWARSQFRSFLPKELIHYSFKSDFWGLYIDGLINILPQIRELHSHAFQLTKNPYFKISNLEELLIQDLNQCDQNLYQRVEARMSAAIWYISLIKEINHHAL